ncbi:kinase-like domain-containing protein [Hypoxylon sp. FL1284]|nr:kinase-like domain-containing protein [Hypoxylon sp. FL1284]
MPVPPPMRPMRAVNIEEWNLSPQILGRIQAEYSLSNGLKEYWVSKEVIGRGEFGEVRRQQCIGGPSVGRCRAVKTIRKPMPLSNSLYTEIEALATFSDDRNDPSYLDRFVRFLGWYEFQDYFSDKLYMVMEYAPHGDLRRRLRNHGCLPEPEAARIILQVAEALKCMHDLGFVHRDLNPKNILIFRPGPHWHVKIADFGMARNTRVGTFPLSKDMANC